MPLTSPAFPIGPLSFRQSRISHHHLSHRSGEAARVVPEPLQVDEPIVKYEFIRMPNSTGFGDYTETGQVIPVTFEGRKGGYAHCMFLNDEPPIAGGREMWGFPKKLAKPSLHVEIDTLVGTLDYGPVPRRHRHDGLQAQGGRSGRRQGVAAAPNFLLKIIPHVDCTPRICELVEYHLEDIDLKGAWTGPAALSCSPTRWRRWPSCRCSKCCRPCTSSPT